MSNLTTIPKGDSAWLLRKAIQQVIEQVNTLETNVNPAATGGSLNTQVLFNDNGAVKGDTNLTFNKTTDTLTTITGQFTNLNASGNVALGNLTVSGTFTALGGENASAVRAAASDYAAVAFDGATASTRITSTLTGQNIGTGDFSVWARFRVPASVNAVNRGLVALTSNATATAQAESAHLFLAANAGELALRLYGATTSDIRQATINGFLTTYTGQVVDVVVTRTGTTFKIYINGTDTAYIETTSGTPPAWSAAVTSTFCDVGMAVGASLFTGRIYRSVVFNRALSASDVTELITVGVNPADQWGTQTAAYTSDFSAGTDSWSAARGTAAGNIDGISGVDNTLRLTVDTTATNSHLAFLNPVPGLLAGKRYRVGFNYFITAANATMNGLALWQLSPSVQISTVQSVTGAWASITPVEFVSGETRLAVLGAAGGNANFTGNGTDTFYLHSFVVTRIGAIVDLDLGVGIGLFFPDRSDNRLGGDGFGGISHVMPREYGSITVVKDLLHSDISATAATTSLFSLPPNCGVMFVELDRVTAFDAGITVQIGVSGTAAKFLAATSVATTGITGANSASLISESNSANTSVFIQKSGATTTGRVRVRVTYQVRG